MLYFLKACFGQRILFIWTDRKSWALLDCWVLIVQSTIAERAFLTVCLLVVEIEGLQESEAAQKRLVIASICRLLLSLLLLVVDHLLMALAV